jgi:hypothetical protein
LLLGPRFVAPSVAVGREAARRPAWRASYGVVVRGTRGLDYCDLAHSLARCGSYRLVAGLGSPLDGAASKGSGDDAAPSVVLQFSSFMLTLVAEACARPSTPAREPPGEIAVPIYRVLSGPGSVIYVFAAANHEDAERFARQVSRHSQPVHPPSRTRCVQVEALVDDDWQRVCAWLPGS